MTLEEAIREIALLGKGIQPTGDFPKDRLKYMVPIIGELVNICMLQMRASIFSQLAQYPALDNEVKTQAVDQIVYLAASALRAFQRYRYTDSMRDVEDIYPEECSTEGADFPAIGDDMGYRLALNWHMVPKEMRTLPVLDIEGNEEWLSTFAKLMALACQELA